MKLFFTFSESRSSLKAPEGMAGSWFPSMFNSRRVLKNIEHYYSYEQQYKYSRLSLSRFPRDSIKYFEISIPRHIRFAELRKKIIRTTTFNKYICNWTLEVRDILKILWKRGEIAP